MTLLGILVLFVISIIIGATIKKHIALTATKSPAQLNTSKYSEEELAAAMDEIEGDPERWKALERKSSS